jgi:hypothetical protein
MFNYAPTIANNNLFTPATNTMNPSGLGGGMGNILSKPATGGTGVFSGLISNTGTTTGGNINTKPTGTIQGFNMSGGLNTGGTGVTTGGFTGGMNSGFTSGLNTGVTGNLGMNVQQSNNSTSPPIFSLLPTNFLKYEKVTSLPEDIKRLVSKIELDLKNNEIYLDYAETLLKGLNENFKIISNEGVKVVKFCKLINSKNSKIKFMLDTLKEDVDNQSEILKKERKHYHIIEHHPTMKITVPSEYFLSLTKEIEEKMMLQIQQISDLESLINLYYRKEYGSFKINSDIVEELIKELYSCLIGLVSEAAKISDYVTTLKHNYFEMMKYQYGWKETEIENRMRNAIELGEDKNMNI